MAQPPAGDRRGQERPTCAAAAAPASRPASKWGFLPAGVYPRYLVVNADESEPGTFKDRMIMEYDPHQLIEGIILTAYAIGAERAFIYVRGEYYFAAERLNGAIAEARARGFLGEKHLRQRQQTGHRGASRRGRL